MCEFEAPSFVYYSHAVVIILSLITGFLIVARNPKHPMNRNAFYFILIIVLWTVDDFLLWMIKNAPINMFFTRISYMADFAVLFFLYFSYYFTGKKITLKNKIFFAIPYMILAVLAHTNYAFKEFDLKTCNYIDGPLIFYLFFLDIVYASWATYVLLKTSHNLVDPIASRLQGKVLAFAIWFFVIWSIIYEWIWNRSLLNGSYTDNTPHFIIGNLFFISLIAFAIIKQGLFNFRNVFLDWFVVFLWSLIFVGLFVFATNPFVIIMFAVAYVILMAIFLKM